MASRRSKAEKAPGEEGKLGRQDGSTFRHYGFLCTRVMCAALQHSAS